MMIEHIGEMANVDFSTLLGEAGHTQQEEP